MKHNSMEAAVKEHLDTRRQLGFALVVDSPLCSRTVGVS